MKGYLTRLTSFVALFGLAVAMMPASAGGVTVTTSPTNGEIDSATAGYAQAIVYWTSSATYASDTQMVLKLAWSDNQVSAPTSSNLLPCSPATTSAFGATGYFSPGMTSSTAIWNHAAIAAGKHGGLCVRVPVADVANTLYTRNFSLSVITTGANVDYGAALFYVNGGNDVTVTATVPATLSFMITQTGSLTTEQHTCDLGTLTIAAVNSCAYRLKIQTNATNGFLAKVGSDHRLGTGYATMTDVGEGVVATGTEGYGFRLRPAATGGRDPAPPNWYNQAAIASGVFASDDSTVPQTITDFVSASVPFVVSTTAMFNATNLVTHRASVGGGTPLGLYTQVVKYYVTGSF